MDEHLPLEPLSPEDMELIIGLAQPMYAESKNVERMTGSNTVVNGRPDDGSSKIRMGLEQIARSIQAPRPVAPPMATYVSPQESSGGSSTTPANFDSPPFIMLPHIVSNPSPQMELDFDVSEQKRTNELLEEISRKLTKLVYHLVPVQSPPQIRK